MKGEERIIELLSEYLQKTDRLLDRFEKTDHNVDTMSRAIADHSIKFNEMNTKFNEMNTKFNEMNAKFNEMNNEMNVKFNQMNTKFNVMNEKFNGEIIDIKQENTIMLKELIAISKRVSVVEDKSHQ